MATFIIVHYSRKIAEGDLNKEYLAAKVRITQDYVSHQQLGDQYNSILIDSQHGWLKYRDGQCQLEAFDAEEGRNTHAAAINLCTTRIDKERRGMLKNMPY